MRELTEEDDSREKRGRPDKGQERREELGESRGDAGPDAPDKMHDAEQPDRDLARYRTEVMERYPSDEETGPISSAERFAAAKSENDRASVDHSKSELPDAPAEARPEAGPSSRNEVGEEISGHTLSSNLQNQPDVSGELPDVRPSDFGPRFGGDQLDRWQASEDVLRGPKSMVVEVQASASGEREDIAKGDKDGGTTADGRPPDRADPVEHEREKAESKDAREYIASFSATAIRQASDGMTKFEVRKEDFERQTKTKLDKDKVYAIEVEIGGVGESRKIYDGNTEGERLAFFAPKESSDSIRVGEKYDVNVLSVKEISATREGMGTFYATAYAVSGREGREDSVRLDIPRATFEKRTGFRFEDGKTYEAKGKVDGKYEFKVTHTGSSENQHVVISFYGEAAKKIEVGKEHTVVVESIEEKRTLTVTGEGPTTRLTLQKRMLESLGIDVDTMRKDPDEQRLVELTVRNLSSTDKSEKTIYGRLQPRDGALPLSIGNTGAKPGDTYEILRAREHTPKNFVEEFNKRTGGVTRNVRLSLEGERLFLEVDGKRFEAKHRQLGVHRLNTFLNLEIEPFKQDIRFWIEGERTAAKLAQSSRLTEEGTKPEPITWRIKSFAASERGLEVTFVMGSRTVTARSGRESLEERMPMEWISERVSVIPGDRLEANHSVRVDDDLVSHISDRLTRTKWSISPYFFEKGGIGEDVGAAAWSKMGYDELERHPFDRKGPGRDPFKTGTDALFRKRDTGELVLVEFKYWDHFSDAGLGQAIEEVRQRRSRETIHPKYGRISGAYVAGLILELGRNRGELRVKRAW